MAVMSHTDSERSKSKIALTLFIAIMAAFLSLFANAKIGAIYYSKLA